MEIICAASATGGYIGVASKQRFLNQLKASSDWLPTMIYLHQLNKGGRGVVSPIDRTGRFGRFKNDCFLPIGDDDKHTKEIDREQGKESW
ncbi:MAG: hypothetical protein ABI575_03580 [Oxalobacteraceae bacterium]